MDISVILCTYNRAEQLRSVLGDLARQVAVKRGSFEVVVVDNNSGDHTKEVCGEFIARQPETFRYLFEQRQGKTFALNAGIRAARGTVLAFTDDDVVIGENWLFSIRRAFAEHRDCRAFGGRVVPLWPDALPAWIATEGAYKNTDGAIVEHDLGNAVQSYCGTEYPPIGANMFFSRDMFLKYGGFNEELNLGVKSVPMLEDTEFCARLLKSGEEMLYIPYSVVQHPVCRERVTKRYFRNHTFKTGRAQYVLKSLQARGRYAVLNLEKNSRRLLNIPFYLMRNSLATLGRYLAAVCRGNSQEIFYCEKLVIYYAGIVYECFSQRKMDRQGAVPHA